MWTSFNICLTFKNTYKLNDVLTNRKTFRTMYNKPKYTYLEQWLRTYFKN